MICPNCRRTVPAEATACPHCHAALPVTAAGVPRGSAVLRPEGDTLREALGDFALVTQSHPLRRLKAAWRKVQAGDGQLVSLVGENGSGRSSLIRQLGRAIDEQEPDALWLAAQAQSYATYSAYNLLAGLLAPWAGEPAGQDVGPRLAAALGALARAARPSERERLAIVARQVGAAPNPGRVAPDRVARALAPALRRVTAGRPLVLVLEDLEWSDAVSLAVLDALLPALLDGATLVLCTHHADWSHDWPDVARQSQIILGPLARAESRQVVETLAGDPPLPEATIEDIVACAGGNPLLLEQVTALVRERDATADAGDAPLPDTLVEALQARVELLPPAARGVLMAAAVVGQRFSYRAVAAVMGEPPGLEDALAELQRRRLIQRWRERPEVVYRFAHGLIQEVAYSALQGRERQALEARAADWLLHESAARGAGPAEVLSELAALPAAAPEEREDRVIETAPAAEAPAVPTALSAERRNEVLARIVLDALPPDQRAGVILCLQHKYTYAAAAAALGLTADEVRASLYEARRSFRELYEASPAAAGPV